MSNLKLRQVAKVKYAVNFDLLTFVGIVKWFDRGRGHIKRDLHPNIRFTSYESFDSGDILHFGLRYNPQLNQDEAILMVCEKKIY